MNKHAIGLAILLMMPLILQASERITVEHSKKNAISILDQLDRSYNFIVNTIVFLPNGKERYKHFQTYNNVTVWDTNLLSNKKEFRNMQLSDLVSGTFVINIEDDISSVKPTLTKDQVLKIVHDCPSNHPDSDKYKLEQAGEIDNVSVDLFIKKYLTSTAKLTYIVQYMDDDDLRRLYHVIDANTGEILEEWEGLPTGYD